MSQHSLKKIMVILGTRPEAIKLSPVIAALRKHCSFEVYVLCTAQHRQMLDQVLEVFNLIPDHDLNIMTSNQTLEGVTVACLQGVGEVLEIEKPDMVLVQGDTTTVFASALACFYKGIPVGHVEAGLRTADLFSPFPEEGNRRLASVLTELHFAPTSMAKENLVREGVPSGKIIITGNTVIDALLDVAERPFDLGIANSKIDHFMSSLSHTILVTAHRRESFGEPFKNMCNAFLDIVKSNSDVGIIYPVHPNPRVRETVNNFLGAHERILLIDPLDYISFVHLMKKAYLILTDSGGIQEEAPSLGKPVLIMRDKTERPEGIEAGVTRLVGTSKRQIVDSVDELLSSKDSYDKMANGNNPFGDGLASQRIVKAVNNYFGGKTQEDI